MLLEKAYVLLETLDKQQLTDGLTSGLSYRRVLGLLGAARAVPGPIRLTLGTRPAGASCGSGVRAWSRPELMP